MNKSCEICRERFMCERILYECPRVEPPNAEGEDELNEEQKKNWAKTYRKLGYRVPRELEMCL